MNIQLPCNLGDVIYIVEDYNPYYDTCKFFKTKYNTNITIKKHVVESFIVEKEGVFISESGHDGFNKITDYHKLTLDKYGDCKIFYSKQEALDFVNKNIRR
jgi:hypothetical protein